MAHSSGTPLTGILITTEPHSNVHLVEKVEHGSPAYVAGVVKGEVLVSLNGEPASMKTHDELIQSLAATGPQITLVLAPPQPVADFHNRSKDQEQQASAKQSIKRRVVFQEGNPDGRYSPASDTSAPFPNHENFAQTVMPPGLIRKANLEAHESLTRDSMRDDWMSNARNENVARQRGVGTYYEYHQQSARQGSHAGQADSWRYTKPLFNHTPQ